MTTAPGTAQIKDDDLRTLRYLRDSDIDPSLVERVTRLAQEAADLADEVRRLRAELEALKPVVVDRDALATEIGGHRKVARYPSGGWKCVCEGWGPETWSQHLADAVLAALYPKATEGKS